ncbi:MAG: sigma-70 family RNA polymerase sigma factor [Candidatus Omnitrophica bacterium]|nr:sigma-70 family RNA polymerase sigma factor [Candidatus Omnitrophota bacterium]
MDDLQFIRSCATLDQKTWHEFLNRYSRLIYTYIYRVTVNLHGLSRSDPLIDDIFQGLLHSLIDDDCRRLRSFKGLHGCSFASWLRLVTINYTLGALRRLRPMAALDEEHDGRSLKDDLVDAGALPDESAIYREHAVHLKECIKRLDSDDKLFVQLVVAKRMSLEAVRQLLRISRSAVDMRKSRLIERLRECFRSKGFM